MLAKFLTIHAWKHSCIAGNRKKQFIIFSGQKIIAGKNLLSSEILWPSVRSSWEVCNPAGPALCVVLIVHILPAPAPPHCWPSDMWGDTSIFWVLRNNSSIHSIAVTQSCDTLVLTESLSLSWAILSPFFCLPWERVVEPFFGLSLCQFSN